MIIRMFGSIISGEKKKKSKLACPLEPIASTQKDQWDRTSPDIDLLWNCVHQLELLLANEWHLKAFNKHDVIITEWAESTTWRWISNETLWKHVRLSHRRLLWSHCHTLRQSEWVPMMKEDWASYLSWSFIFISHQFRDFKKSQTFCASRTYLCLYTLWKVVVHLLTSCATLCDPIDYSTPAFPVLHQLLEFAQTCAHWVGNAIQLSHPLSPSSPPVLNLSQYQGLFQWVTSFHQVIKVLEFQLQLQHQSFQWIFRIDFL